MIKSMSLNSKAMIFNEWSEITSPLCVYFKKISLETELGR